MISDFFEGEDYRLDTVFSRSESVKSMAKELRAYAFLDKPFNIDGLVKVVKKALK